MSNTLEEYIKNQIISGKSLEEIQKTLLEKGWDTKTIATALRPYKGSSFGKFFTLPTTFNKKPVIAAMVVFLVGMGALAIVYGYLYYYLDPGRILSRSLYNFSKVDAYSFSGTIRAEYDKPQEETALQTPISFSSAFTGSFVHDRSNGPKYNISLTANAGTVNVAQLDAIKINSTLYLQPKQLSDLGFINNERILNRWIEFDLHTIPVSTPTFLSLFSGPLSDTQTKDLVRQFREKPPILITTQLPEDNLDGVETYHYLYTVRKDHLISFFQSHHPEKSDEINAFFSQIDFRSGELWIAKKGNYPIRATSLFVRRGVERGAPSLNISIDIRLKDIGVKTPIDPPSSATPLMEIVQEVSNVLNKEAN